MAAFKNGLIVAFTYFVLSGADVTNRKLETLLYPDCNSYPDCVAARDTNVSGRANFSFPNVAYVRGSNKGDVLHYVFTTIRFPAVLVVHTTGDPKAQLRFDWDLLLNQSSSLSGAVNLTGGTVQYSFAVVFSRLFEYNDINDEADMSMINSSDLSLWRIRRFSDFDWMNVTEGKGGKSIVFNTTSLQPDPAGNATKKGCITFEFELNGGEGRDDDLPRLMTNANNTQLNLALDQFVPSFANSRFALEMSLVGNQTFEQMSLQTVDSIDDEYSPGVFKVKNWFGGKRDETGYLQWKPVCYLAEHRARGVGTEVQVTALTPPSLVYSVDDWLDRSVAAAFFGNYLIDLNAVQQRVANMSFGMSKDGFYLKNNYTVWTASVGYGQAPVESISTMVIAIITAGLGIPVLIIIFGGVYVCIKRRKQNDYQNLDRGVYPAVN